MKNINIKSKKGFTLIELLVVIGILAVLATIAIPSVAGLIDRANVSADNTNANEMTNAIERFASEYELYCQDISSGTLDTNNLNSAQGRVYNIVMGTSREDIEFFEKEQINRSEDISGVAVYRDTKYPVNTETTQLIIQNYMKTSSSTFEPKQSDCSYYYSPDCGIIVVADNNVGVSDLNALVVSNRDAKGKELTDQTQWIDITNDKILSGISLDLSMVDPILANNDWKTIKKVIRQNKVSEVGWEIGDLTPTFSIYGKDNVQARLVSVGGDGKNTATFMLTSSIGNLQFNPIIEGYPTGYNIGGYGQSAIKNKLDTIVFNSISNDLKSVIKPIDKICTGGADAPSSTSTVKCKLFLLSAKEVNIHTQDLSSWYSYMDAVLKEGSTYEWFALGNDINADYWLRTTCCHGTDSGIYCCNNGQYISHSAKGYLATIPAFVIG